MAQVTKQIISPVFVTESGDSYIALDGKAFLVGENTITEAEITTAPGEFRSLVLALNNFTLTNEGLTWFNGINRIRFVKESNNFFVNNSEVLAESLTNHLLASGIVNYTNKAKIQLFEYAAQNINNFVSLDFAQKIEEGNVKCYVMKLNEDFFVYRINEANKIYKFGKLDANAAFDYVKEQTGYEITDMTQELLEGARKEAAEKLEKINLLEQMIAFLKDQRGVIAEADKSIQEIKEADTLINSEIKRLEEEVEAIKNGTEKVDEGCGKCGTDGCICATESEETETDATTEETTNEEATEETVKEGKDKWIVYDTESKEILEIYKDLKAAEAFADKQKNAEVAAADFYHSRIKENTETEATNEEAGDEAGVEAEDIKADHKEVDSDEKREAKSEEADDSAPSDEGEDGAKEVAEAEVTEDDAEDIEDAEAEMGEPEKSEEDQEKLEAPMDEADVEEELVTRQDGYVPGTLKYETDDFAEGTEIQIDAEAYTTSGQDESITVFVNEKPLKVNKRDVELADGETV
jgi:hypothetical protein